VQNRRPENKAPAAELFFINANGAEQAGERGNFGKSVRAVGTGGVVVEQGDRRVPPRAAYTNKNRGGGKNSFC